MSKKEVFPSQPTPLKPKNLDQFQPESVLTRHHPTRPDPVFLTRECTTIKEAKIRYTLALQIFLFAIYTVQTTTENKFQKMHILVVFSNSFVIS